MNKNITTMRLDRLLSNMGYGSRREVRQMVEAGLVTLDGTALENSEQRIPVTPDLPLRMCVDDAALDPLPGLALILHKPLGVTCSHKEAGALVYGLLPPRWLERDPAVSTIGRLDKETSGLLLLTDDGVLLHRIISPRNHVSKRYHAVLLHELRGDEADIFASGKMLIEGEDEFLQPVQLEILSPLEVYVTLTEGRYHQVRRMFAAVGNHVVSLHRDRIGKLTLPEELSPGQYRIMSDSDISLVFS